MPAFSLAADSPTLTLTALLTRIEALEGKTRHLRTDLQQTKTEAAAARSELTESQITFNTAPGAHHSRCCKGDCF